MGAKKGRQKRRNRKIVTGRDWWMINQTWEPRATWAALHRFRR
jgi:hypothetical protein